MYGLKCWEQSIAVDAEIRLAVESSTPAAARTRVLDALGATGEAADDIGLLVSEIVTNVVRHTPALEVVLSAGRVDSHYRVESWSMGPIFDIPTRTVDEVTAGGYGLFIVDRVAQRWGVEADETGTRVWFEVPVGATAAA